MTTPEHNEILSLPTADEYQELASRFMQLSSGETQEYILWRGFGDEITEILEQAYGDEYWTTDTLPTRNELPDKEWLLELGDLLWYTSQVARLRGQPLSDYYSKEQWENDTLDEEPDIRTLLSRPSKTTETFGFGSSPEIILGELASQRHSLRGMPSGLNEEDAFKRIMDGIRFAANSRGMSLAKIAQANINKLENRTRQPHTVTQIESGQESLTRSKVHLWLSSMED